MRDVWRIGVSLSLVVPLLVVGTVSLAQEAVPSVIGRTSHPMLFAGLLDTLRTVLLSPADQARLHAYHKVLAQETRRLPGRRVSLADLLPALFAQAQARARHGDPITENRAALLVLALYTSGRGLTRLVPRRSPGHSL